jgi:hypothetical protein
MMAVPAASDSKVLRTNMNASPLFGLCLNRVPGPCSTSAYAGLRGDMASFATRLSIGRWATFRRKAKLPRMKAIGAGVSKYLRPRAEINPSFRASRSICLRWTSHHPVFHLYECTNEMVLSTRPPL